MANYEQLKNLARQKRLEYSVTTSGLGLKTVRKIYKAEGITIDAWKLPARIRAVYMCDDGDPSVLISRMLPKEPKLFSLVHELKHHYLDRDTIASGKIRCGDYNANQDVEIGAEVFAAEFIYPEREFLDCLSLLDIRHGKCTAEDVVRLKRACGAPVSYTFLRKRLERMGFVPQGHFAKIQFQKLEGQMFGLPIYKQPWFVHYRNRQRN
jgi:Zn-dependent peptidase ImmA (M78 family)